MVGRFAPSCTGRAHPGTLLAALLAWLDIRQLGGRLLLRLEDLDRERCRPEFVSGLQADLQWFGLDFDAIQQQSQRLEHYATALRQLATGGHLYRCECSRSQLRQAAPIGADGSRVYPGTCRALRLGPAAPWPAAAAIRCQLPAATVQVDDLLSPPLTVQLGTQLGDPVLRRRDGAVAYHLASVVDDAAAGVNRVVRGRDLHPGTAVQVALQELLQLPRPRYGHHLLLLQDCGEKLSKFHGAVAVPELQRSYSPEALCGVLAAACGLRPTAAACTPAELLADFDWARVERRARLLVWDGRQLQLGQAVPQ